MRLVRHAGPQEALVLRKADGERLWLTIVVSVADPLLTALTVLLAVMLFTSKGGAGVAGSAIVVLASTLASTGTMP